MNYHLGSDLIFKSAFTVAIGYKTISTINIKKVNSVS